MFFGKSISFVIMMGISGQLTSSLSFIHTLWIYMLQVFGMYCVMLDLVVGLLCYWHQWIGNHTSNVWNLIPSCLMLIVWLEWKYYSFEDTEKMLEELFVLCQHSLFDWSHCWDFINCSSLLEFMHSLRIISGFLSSYCCCCCCCFFFFFFPIVHHHNQLVFFLLFSLIIFLLITCKKKMRHAWGSCYKWDWVEC